MEYIIGLVAIYFITSIASQKFSDKTDKLNEQMLTAFEKLNKRIDNLEDDLVRKTKLVTMLREDNDRHRERAKKHIDGILQQR